MACVHYSSYLKVFPAIFSWAYLTPEYAPVTGCRFMQVRFAGGVKRVVGRARTPGSKPVPVISVVLVPDLKVEVPWLNAPCQPSSIIELFTSGLTCYTNTIMPTTQEGNRELVLLR